MKAFPFDPAHYRQHVPEISRRIEALKPHVIVMGLGPSAWMLREVDPKILEGIRLWGVNDVWDIMPVHDITVMDLPIRELEVGCDRYKTLVASTPARWWLYDKYAPKWHKHLQARPDQIRSFPLTVWRPGKWSKKPRLAEIPHHHTISSPIGTISVAWAEGCRRIGVIGVDLLEGQHRLSDHHEWVDYFVGKFARQAKELGGQIVNLSPFSRLKSIHPDGEAQQCPSASS